MKFFDCNCSIGRTNITNPGSFDSPEILVKKMEEYGIGDALVYHAVARDHVPAEGNPLLDEITEKFTNIHPVWIIMPHYTGEFPEPEKLYSIMVGKKIKAVRIFPSAQRHNFSIKKYSLEPLMQMLSDYKVPLFVDIDEIGWENIDGFLEDYPGNPVVLCNTGYRSDRFLYPLMEKFSNLHIETSRFISNFGIEALCSRFGPERILFGTQMPLYTGAGAVYYIKNLELDQKDKEKIASQNLERLLGGAVI